ncbi:MAG: hypothetical protein IKM59_00460 [Oscillospiraceae bacterium]|nr:hypothetical protein [Oscillospiraceae bacterium]
MAKKHNKKKRRGLPVPPLSPLDKFLYFLGSVLLAAFIIGILLFRLIVIPRWIAMADSGMIAITEGVGVLLWTPFLLYIAISGACMLGKGFDCRIPIFGNKRVKYGPPRWGEVYPLFSKNRPVSHIEQRPSHVIVIQYANLHYLDRLLREDKPTQEEEQLIYEILDIETEGGDKP